ncbi:MAG TPA: selenocysteine-specific translation elongation factor [Candidatus Limnocylindrales bacterium]|nr:selenocysteine-specific translation elongation factor [Candidatus Limnocylindrales bacterium]
MTIVVGTAGHIDHGKTTLLRALTGIDADRLPEERRRGMTIDVGYAYLDLEDGTTIDFVDVPGHDKLVGNMLVGAGEIDAALLVVAADDGPRAQTHEHVALLDALGIAPAIVAVTKIDAVAPERVEAVRAEVPALLAATSMAGAPILAASGSTGAGVDALRDELIALQGRVGLPAGPPTIALDRVFSVKGRGVVVTGTLRGGPLRRGDTLRVVPGDGWVRVREIQVHGTSVDAVETGGRTALNLAGVGVAELHRGMVLTADAAVVVTDRALVAFRAPVADRAGGRVHAGTAAVDATIGRSGRDALTLPDGRPAGILRLRQPIALREGDRFVFRRGAQLLPVGGIVLDPIPSRGISRRRQTPDRVAAVAAGHPDARLDLHGLLDREMAPDVAAAAEAAVLGDVPDEAPLSTARATAARALRREVTVRRADLPAAANAVIDRLVADGRLVRVGDTLRRPGRTATGPDPALVAAMARLEAALDVPVPPALSEAARVAACPPAGIRELERTGRVVVLEPDLAYAMATYRDLADRALSMAARAPLTPASFRDATGTSRKYVIAILEDLDRRAILRRTPAGHVPGPKAPTVAGR